MGWNGDKMKIYGKKWRDLCLPKLDEGLGFKDAGMFNITLLAKQWWRLLNGKNLLSSRVLRAKYCSNGSLNMSSRGNHDSFIWSCLLMGETDC